MGSIPTGGSLERKMRYKVKTNDLESFIAVSRLLTQRRNVGVVVVLSNAKRNLLAVECNDLESLVPELESLGAIVSIDTQFGPIV